MRIPERNRILRPEIAHLLNEVENQLTLENQVTQPLRRQDILQHQQEPILEGNLPPADLPNPFEPVSQEEAHSGPTKIWTTHTPSYPIESDNEED